MPRRRLSLAVAFIATTTTLPAWAYATLPPALERAVLEASHGSTQPYLFAGITGEPLVEILKHDSDTHHVLGSVTRMLPPDVHGTPPTTFFLANEQQGDWRVGLLGSDGFLDELSRMPMDVLDEGERHAFTLAHDHTSLQHAPAGEFINIGLPWMVGMYGTIMRGPHGDDGRSRPFNSIDFTGQDGLVRAPAGGRVYTSCVRDGSALRTIVHPNGYSTSYYHMERLPTLPNGAEVVEGDSIGSVGNGVPCGGESPAAHVHVSLLRGNEKIAVDNLVLGGWTFHQGWFNYQGWAQRASTRVDPGSKAMRNFGSEDQGL